MNIGIDLLGSENSPKALLDSALEFSALHPFKLHAFGPKLTDCSELIWHECNHEVRMETAGIAAAASETTSMSLGLEALKAGVIDVFISCGNTAALLTYSHFLLNKLPGVKRLGLLAQIGTAKKPCYMIDVGANIGSSPYQLHQFTLIGHATYKVLHGSCPKIGILNIASEKGKGPAYAVELFKRLEQHPDFIGFIEPQALFQGACDLVITEGFCGNILLKTAEAVAKMTLGSAIGATCFDPSSYPGALLCGADNLVMKCHGIGDTRALQRTLQEALRLKSQNYLTRVKQEISALKEESF